MKPNRKKTFLFFFALFGIFLSVACTEMILNKGFPQVDGEIAGLPVSQPVEVFRDSFGIPHIYAKTEKDLMCAQGYVHAQDRLWQMETYRRLATGRLSEIAGEEILELDVWMRMLGIPKMRKHLAAQAKKHQADMANAYISGINAYIEQNKDNLPLEFQKLNFVPDPWTIEDIYSVACINAWFLQTNLAQELLALSAKEHFDAKGLKELMPSWPETELPDDSYFDSLRKLNLGPFLAAVDSLYLASSHFEGTGSNNWVVAKGEDGKPLLSGDPHLALTVPGVWYFAHLEAPGFRAAGATMPGTPGIIIGHNENIAWSWTNVMTDITDLYVFRSDPADPMSYFVGDEMMELEKRVEVFKLPGGKEAKREIYWSVQGPVISQIGLAYDGFVALKWFGSVPAETIDDKTSTGFFKLNRAKTVQEAFEAGRYFKLFGQNLVVADTEGNIGWHAFGGVPIRKGYSGRLPADGSAGTMDWTGLIAYDDLPSLYNPEQGFIATANNKTDQEMENKISYSWCAPYRVSRIYQMLEGFEKPPSWEDFRSMQLDVHSLQADKIIPGLQDYSFSDPKAAKAMELLSTWDHESAINSVGATVYNMFLNQWLKNLLEDELGKNLRYYYHTLPLAYGIQDVILDHIKSPVWDRIDTVEKETPQQILEASLKDTYESLEKILGADPASWQWGQIHHYYFAHPGAKRKFEHKMLSRGPFAAPGDNTTVNAANFDPTVGDFGVLVIPSLRMIASLGDLDQTTICGPMGQSGQAGHPHYDDMIKPWIGGGCSKLYFSRQDVTTNAAHTLVLKP